MRFCRTIHRRRGLTLVEVVLATGLLVSLTSLTYWFYASSLETQRSGTAAAQRLRLVRTVMDRIATEIRQATSISTRDRVGIRGTGDRLWLSTHRVPSRDSAPMDLEYRDDPPPAEYDMAKIEYKIARHPEVQHPDGYDFPLGLARVQLLIPRPDSAQTGAAFEKKGRVVGESDEARLFDEALAEERELSAEEDGDEEDFGPEIQWQELYAAEIRSLRFCYYDGNQWWNDWEVTGDNPLPQLVMMTIGFEPRPPYEDEFIDREMLEFCTCLNEDPVDCKALGDDQYSIIVRVAQADPLFRSRITRESQAMIEGLTGGGEE